MRPLKLPRTPRRATPAHVPVLHDYICSHASLGSHGRSHYALITVTRFSDIILLVQTSFYCMSRTASTPLESDMQEADREIQELLHWMREDGASSDEEADMLMALAQQAGPTPKSQTPGSSQKVLSSMTL